MDDGGSQKPILEFNETKVKEQRGSGEIDGYSATVQPTPPQFWSTAHWVCLPHQGQ